jgi:23S rRNA pseudouridine2604 synthase
MPTLKLNKATAGARRKRPPVRGIGTAPFPRGSKPPQEPANPMPSGRPRGPSNRAEGRPDTRRDGRPDDRGFPPQRQDRPRGPGPGPGAGPDERWARPPHPLDRRTEGPPHRRDDPPWPRRPEGPRDAFGNTADGPWHDRGRDPRRDLRSDPPRRAPSRPAPLPADADHPRLSKRISELGLASRREADEWIPKGWVKVDGRVVKELGSRVSPQAVITLDPQAQSEQASRATVLLHKPLGLVSGQAEDGHAPAITLVRADTQWDLDGSGRRFDPGDLRWLAPAGRLDLDSTGLLVLTQDGRVARQLIGEDSEVEKEYRVRIEPMAGRGPLDDGGLALLRHGLALDGQALRPAEVDLLEPGLLRVVLREGRKRQIRRMCEAVGQQVVSLQRVRIGTVVLGDLPEGRWRYLQSEESFTPGAPRFR